MFCGQWVTIANNEYYRCGGVLGYRNCLSGFVCCGRVSLFFGTSEPNHYHSWQSGYTSCNKKVKTTGWSYVSDNYHDKGSSWWWRIWRKSLQIWISHFSYNKKDDDFLTLDVGVQSTRVMKCIIVVKDARRWLFLQCKKYLLSFITDVRWFDLSYFTQVRRFRMNCRLGSATME